MRIRSGYDQVQGDNEGHALQALAWAWTQVDGHGHGLIEGGSGRMG